MQRKTFLTKTEQAPSLVLGENHYLGEPIDEDFMRLLESKLSPQELTEVLEDSLRRNFLVASNEINYLLKNFWVVDNKVA